MPVIVLLHGVQSSRTTWWRIEQDLTDLGWEVHALDLLGHGSRPGAATSGLSVDDLARDVADRLPGPVDLVAGHALGAIVGLTLAGLRPDLVRGLVIEDPPGLAGDRDPGRVAGKVASAVRAARADPDAVRVALLEENPLWSPIDAWNAVDSRRALNLPLLHRVLEFAG